jgi:hypothetical protein
VSLIFYLLYIIPVPQTLAQVYTIT